MRNKLGSYCLLFVFLSFLSFYACEQGDRTTGANSCISCFFNASGADERLGSIVAQLKQKNDSSNFISDFVAEYGYPLWKDAYKFPEGDHIVYAVPVKSIVSDSKIENIWFFSMGYNCTEYRIYTRQMADEITAQVGDDGTEQTWMFDYFTRNALHKKTTSGFIFEKDTIPAATKAIYTAETTYCNHIISYTGDYTNIVDHGYHCWTTTAVYFFDIDEAGGGGDGAGGNLGIGSGGGGGGGSGTTPASSASAAYKLFNASTTLANWNKLQTMVDKIILDCMGGNLYGALANSGKINTTFTSGASSYNPATNTINLNTSLESNQLLHEMWHVYQASKLSTADFNNSTINQEIEAHYAQYLYISKLPEYKGSKWEKSWTRHPRLRTIANLKDIVDNKGYLLPNKTNGELDFVLNQVASMFETHEYTDDNIYVYNWNIKGLDNFKNLRELSKNCL